MAVITDSVAALTPELILDHELFVARMEITVDGKTIVDTGSSELDEFYSTLASSKDVPTTSAAKPVEYLDRMNSAADIAESVFCVTVSAKLSAAYDAALLSSDEFSRNNPDHEVRIFDSAAAAGSQALIVLAAARVAKRGGSIDEVETAAKFVARRVRLVAMLDTLRFIHRSGRVPKIAVWATTALNIKPVMEFSADKIRAIARPRSVRKAVDRIRKDMLTDLDGRIAHINVMHAGAPERAEALREWAESNLESAEIFVTQFHPFMGAHTGPGLVGASWWSE